MKNASSQFAKLIRKYLKNIFDARKRLKNTKNNAKADRKMLLMVVNSIAPCLGIKDLLYIKKIHSSSSCNNICHIQYHNLTTLTLADCHLILYLPLNSHKKLGNLVCRISSTAMNSKIVS